MNNNYKCTRIPSHSEKVERIYSKEERNGRAVVGITFQITEDCCLNCSYCYQHKKTHNKMTFNTAKVFIDKLLNNEFEILNLEKIFAISVEFIGGEPLMEIELIEEIWEYFMTQMILLEHPWVYNIRMSICSNGILYETPKVQKFFNKYHNFISFSVSIDGNKELHDSCRVDLNGNGSYDTVVSTVKSYQSKYKYLPGTKMTLAPNNISYLYDSILSLMDLGYTEINLNCIYESGWNSKHAKIMYNDLKKIADYILNNDLYNKIYVSLFEENYFTPIDPSENTNWCGGVADTSVAINYEGNMYPCIRYMEHSLNKKQEPIIFGDVFSGYLSTSKYKQNYLKVSNITRRSQSTDECFYCPIAQGCSWCSAYNYEETGSVNKRVTYICIMHKARALANVYYWNKLYQKLNLPLKFDCNIPKEWALEIIDEKEYNYLLKLSEGE